MDQTVWIYRTSLWPVNNWCDDFNNCFVFQYSAFNKTKKRKCLTEAASAIFSELRVHHHDWRRAEKLFQVELLGLRLFSKSLKLLISNTLVTRESPRWCFISHQSDSFDSSRCSYGEHYEQSTIGRLFSMVSGISCCISCSSISGSSISCSSTSPILLVWILQC